MGINEMNWPSDDDIIPTQLTVTTVGETDEPAKKPKKKREYSKAALAAMIVLWFIGAFFGMAVVVWQLITAAYTVNIGDVLMYISGPMTGGIVTYMVKSALENREKIKKPDVVDDDAGGNGRGE